MSLLCLIIHASPIPSFSIPFSSMSSLGTHVSHYLIVFLHSFLFPFAKVTCSFLQLISHSLRAEFLSTGTFTLRVLFPLLDKTVHAGSFSLFPLHVSPGVLSFGGFLLPPATSLHMPFPISLRESRGTKDLFCPCLHEVFHHHNVIDVKKKKLR